MGTDKFSSIVSEFYDYAESQKRLEKEFEETKKNRDFYKDLYNSYMEMYNKLYAYVIDLISQEFVNKEEFYKWHNAREENKL